MSECNITIGKDLSLLEYLIGGYAFGSYFPTLKLIKIRALKRFLKDGKISVHNPFTGGDVWVEPDRLFLRVIDHEWLHHILFEFEGVDATKIIDRFIVDLKTYGEGNE